MCQMVDGITDNWTGYRGSDLQPMRLNLSDYNTCSSLIKDGHGPGAMVSERDKRQTGDARSLKAAETEWKLVSFLKNP